MRMTRLSAFLVLVDVVVTCREVAVRRYIVVDLCQLLPVKPDRIAGRGEKKDNI